MRGYKAFNMDLKCRGFQYEVGKTYKLDVAPKLCARGFHFCTSVKSCFNYYERDDSRVCEIEAESVEDDGEKHVTGEITIVRELSLIEINRQMYGNGYGYGDGNGNGNGYGNGYGYGYGDGDGDGYGNGYGDGNGNGNGYGYGDGNGNGNGNGYGYGDGDGYGNGYGYGRNIQKILNYMEEIA